MQMYICIYIYISLNFYAPPTLFTPLNTSTFFFRWCWIKCESARKRDKNEGEKKTARSRIGMTDSSMQRGEYIYDIYVHIYIHIHIIYINLFHSLSLIASQSTSFHSPLRPCHVDLTIYSQNTDAYVYNIYSYIYT